MALSFVWAIYYIDVGILSSASKNVAIIGTGLQVHQVLQGVSLAVIQLKGFANIEVLALF